MNILDIILTVVSVQLLELVIFFVIIGILERKNKKGLSNGNKS